MGLCLHVFGPADGDDEPEEIAECDVGHYSDFGCFREANYGANLSGAPQAPYFVDAYPAGVARVLRAGSFIGLNAHYHNGFDVPIQIKVWTNVYPYTGTPDHVAQTVTSLDSTFSISVLWKGNAWFPRNKCTPRQERLGQARTRPTTLRPR